ncbi:MAG: ParA family protein [bacterium]|nr:ParA family protein [bacterium]
MFIAILNHKGGVGKTTSTINLGHALALLGFKTLLIDADPQANTTSIFIDTETVEVEKGKSIAALFKKKANVKATIWPAEINKVKIDNLSIIPSVKKLDDVELGISIVRQREKLLSKSLEGIDGEYDFVLFDCRPTLGPIGENVINAADFILIPTDCSRFSLDGIADLLELIQEIKGDDYQYGILKNKFDRRNKRTIRDINDALAPFKEYTFDTIIGLNEKLSQSQMQSSTIFPFDKNCRGAKDFTALASELVEAIK